MMSAPPVPPRPYDSDQPPPVPPLPPRIHNDYDDPLVAPTHLIFSQMARTLDDSINYSPGFAMPSMPSRSPSPLPPPQGAAWSPWQIGPLSSPPPPPPPGASLAHSMSALSFSSSPPPMQSRTPSIRSTYGPPPKAPSPPHSAASPEPSAVPSLSAPLPSLPSLTAALPSVQQPSHDPALRLAWCRDVFFLVDRSLHISADAPPVGPISIADPALLRLSQVAVPLILQLASSTQLPPPPYVAEALYIRATLAATGAYPEVRHNPRSAFRDFEAAARAGFAAAWFRLGRDYENFNDEVHAKECFERGVKLGVESCTYRMGMAHLLGQLSLPASPAQALPLLHRAALLSTIQVPQPAYTFALLLLSEFPSPSSPTSPLILAPSLFASFIPPTSTALLEARVHLERAAYLCFAPAQYKLGHAYEFAVEPWWFDPLLSVQYYSLASQQGEVEADMALSKWFLCGSGSGEDGGFDKDEGLAWTFADKAARRGLPSAEFAMGYYAEVGVGGPKDLTAAIKWYTKAKEHGNADASERLSALSLPSPQALSRVEHNNITETKLVRKRTQAKQKSDNMQLHQAAAAAPSAYPSLPMPGTSGSAAPYQSSSALQPPPPSQGYGGPQQRQGMRPGDGKQVIDVIRKNSMISAPYHRDSQGPGGERMSSLLEHPSQQQQQAHPPFPSGPVHSQSMPAPNNQGQGRGRPQGRAESGWPPSTQQQQQQQQQFPGSNRYTLTDSPAPGGPKGGNGGGRPASGAGRGGGRPGTAGTGGERKGERKDESGHVSPTGGRPHGGKGPTTFAEMGFQGAKAEDKECIIM